MISEIYQFGQLDTLFPDIGNIVKAIVVQAVSFTLIVCICEKTEI
jgi:hypothetical protein